MSNQKWDFPFHLGCVVLIDCVLLLFYRRYRKQQNVEIGDGSSEAGTKDLRQMLTFCLHNYSCGYAVLNSGRILDIQKALPSSCETYFVTANCAKLPQSIQDLQILFAALGLAGLLLVVSYSHTFYKAQRFTIHEDTDWHKLTAYGLGLLQFGFLAITPVSVPMAFKEMLDDSFGFDLVIGSAVVGVIAFISGLTIWVCVLIRVIITRDLMRFLRRLGRVVHRGQTTTVDNNDIPLDTIHLDTWQTVRTTTVGRIV